VAEFTPPESNAPTPGALLVTVTISALPGLNASGLRSVPPLNNAPTMALNVLDPFSVVVLVGAPESEIPEDTTATGALPVAYFGVVAVKVALPVDPNAPCTKIVSDVAPAGKTTLVAGAPNVVEFGATKSSPGFELRTSTVTPPVGAAVVRPIETDVCSPPPTPMLGLETVTVPRLAAA
jgi:hypothetical protein